MKTLAEKAAALAARIDREIKASAGKGLGKAVKFIEARVKEAANVKAPTREVVGRDGRKYLVATTKATPGAPLRVVSGRFFRSITSQMEDEFTGVVGSNAHADLSHAARFVAALTGENTYGFGYPGYWEVKNPVHQTFTPTFERWMPEIKAIIGGDVKIDLGAA